MPRPTKFTDETAAAILRIITEDGGRECAAMVARIGRRTLETWLAKGRAGDPAFARFAELFEVAERTARTRRYAWLAKEQAARSRERYQEFKARRIAWHRARLGEAAFWATRLRWLRANGHDSAADRLTARLLAEGFGTKETR